jgi:Mrp family chromosome partitioning ATPase
MVIDSLPEKAWLTDLGTFELRDLPRPERVLQLCHPDLNNEFPPPRTPKTIAVHNLPTQLTSFIGRGEQLVEVQQALGTNRLVTLTGAGGVGKTRLAVEVAASLADELDGGVWFVDLAVSRRNSALKLPTITARSAQDAGRGTDSVADHA